MADQDVSGVKALVENAETGFPRIPSQAYATEQGTPYLRAPGVALISKPAVAIDNISDFLGGFSPKLDFPQYLDDPTPLPPGTQLCKTAGQTCYASFGPKRTMNADADRYFRNIVESGHGSVLEHANFTFLFYGISRSATHELVRHRAGAGYCLTGDTLVYSNHYCNGRHEGVKKRSIERLAAMSQTSHGRSRLKLLRLRCLDETSNTFVSGRLKAVVCSGIKPVFRVELEDGKAITCSKEHRFLTPAGWKPLAEIVGDLDISPGGLACYGSLDTAILTNGAPAYKDRTWLEEHYLQKNLSQSELADFAGIPRETIKYWLKKHGLKKPLGVKTRWTKGNEGKQYIERAWLHEQYIVNNLDQASIAALVGVSTHTIRSWIRRHKLQKPLGSWTIGHVPWNKNKRYKAGWKQTPEMRQRISEQKRGEKNPQWKGGITARGIQLRRGVQELRPQIMQRDGYRCRLCGKHSKRMAMHHILPVWARPDLVLDPDNIATVCFACHWKINGHEFEYVEHFGRSMTEIGDSKEPPRGSGFRLIPRARKIKSITYAGEQMTYDLEMEGPHHNFVANGIITHNSQVSQRYVSGRVLRFVERPEYQDDPELHAAFERRIDAAAADYEAIAEQLMKRQKEGDMLLSGEARTDLRKKVQQTARSVLPNETEAPIVVTANARAWRHILEMRANPHAETEIRELAFRTYLCLVATDPILFGDYRIVALPDGTFGVETDHPKV